MVFRLKKNELTAFVESNVGLKILSDHVLNDDVFAILLDVQISHVVLHLSHDTIAVIIAIIFVQS